MVAAGFVLAGGRSRRMGRDKAMLPYRGGPLIAHVAGTVEKALGDSGRVAIIGEPERYRDLGYTAHADLFPNRGPLGGIITALILGTSDWGASDWNLVVACDMPNLTEADLRKLLDRASVSGARSIAARNPAGETEPLCAVYHRKCLPTLMQALQEKRLKLRELLPELEPEWVALPAESLANLNTPQEWLAFEEQPG